MLLTLIFTYILSHYIHTYAYIYLKKYMHSYIYYIVNSKRVIKNQRAFNMRKQQKFVF